MSKQQSKTIQTRIAALKAAIAVSKANAKNANKAKFRKVSQARVTRLQARIAAMTKRAQQNQAA
jgi:hypothetical protein